MSDHVESRRAFTGHALRSLTAVALLEGLASHRLFGADVQPLVDGWLAELNAISRQIHDHEIKDVEFTRSLEALYRRVDLASLLKTLDFEKIARGVNYPALGAKSLPVDFKNVAGLSTGAVFGRQIFAMKRGRSVVPHGHDNMATGFVVLRGTLHGRHYDRLEDHKDHYIIRPTIDRSFKPGDFSTVSDHKDNVHWFTAETETAFLFNIHVNDTNPENPNPPSRVYVDPVGSPLAGGLIKAPKVTYAKVNQMYG